MWVNLAFGKFSQTKKRKYSNQMAYYSSTDDISFVPLTREEEVLLFTQFYDGDLAARDVLIKNHLKLVAKLALQISGRGGIPDEDAISAANYGLIQALESKCFDPTRGLRFSTYVRKYVHGQVLDAIVARCRGFESDARESGCYSEDAVVTGAQNRGSHEDIASGNTAPTFRFKHPTEEHAEPITSEQDLSSVRKEKLLKVIEALPEPERLALRSHYFEDRNFADIARRRNECRPSGDKKRTTREGVRKAHNRGLCKLKTALAHLEPELS